MKSEHDTTAAAATVEPSHLRTEKLISLLAERLGASFGASTVFGAPVERDGVTVVPVAAVRLGFGGGSGSDPSKGGEGEGAGGGGSMTATGYIELKDGRSRYVPMVRPERMVALACLALVAGFTLARPPKLARPAKHRRRRVPFVA